MIELSKASLISRVSTSKALSVHRLVQFAVFNRLSGDDRRFYLDTAISLLVGAFPNTWQQTGHAQGHGWNSWQTCGAVLPHVSRLVTLTREQELSASDEEAWAELIFRAGTYLWEKEQPTLAKSFLQYGLTLNINRDSPSAAQAYRLLGHVALDMAQPHAALTAYQQALSAREKLSGPNTVPVAAVYDSIACSYTEMGDVKSAFEILEKATAIHLQNDPNGMARTKAIWALTYLRAGQPQEALQALLDCWKLQNKTQTQIEESRYPKHSGDIMLLARIKYVQGQKDEGQKLASRTISIRKGLLGDKGPRVADSTFVVARMLEAEGEDVLAAKLLREVVDMSRGMLEMKGHLARACWFLAHLEKKLNHPVEAEELLRRAKEEKSKIEGKECPDEESDEAYLSLVGWMLW